ncbi:PREDICTED: uncharacterized protein LOC108746374 [Trachymyrmex septentrionalis]|uniref:uncharacterized protein LOC108746374 n=1 Tax=Trachymyrmex septentrionalis TaxID=34720 RepID=UPI00084F2DF0|nr:PREDICTED: uncharacterized protein LOC108746374 [Trachymyrmex septentrionalis]
MPIIRYYINSNSIEPLEMKNLFPSAMNIIEIIQEYEKRCFVMHQRLRTDRRCHPKLRNYVESFNLDRQSFIRHIILYCFKIENEMYGLALTLIFFRDFGWANEMIAYENIMQISAEALQIALMNIESFSKNTFVMLLHSIISFSNKIENFMPDNNQKEVRRILLKTLSSTKDVVGEKRYKLMYNFLLKYVYHGNPSYLTGKYNETSEWIYALIHGYVPCTISLIDCTCDECLYCKRQNFFKNNIATMYNAYLFICECIKISTECHDYYEQLLRNLCPE